MFKVIDDPQFTEDVPVDVPDGEGGWRRETLRTRFRALSDEDLKAVDEAGGDTSRLLLDRAVVSFENLVDGEGKPLRGDGEWRDRHLGYAFIRADLIRHYYRSVMGARAGNSAPSAAPGPRAS